MALTKTQIRDAYRRLVARSVRTPSGCLEFQGARTDGGYASIRIGRRVMAGHRVAWLATRGPIPKGQQVLHGCDNPPCIEPGPGHLHLGTMADNMREAIERRRIPRGELVPVAKLTNAQADEIRVRFFTEPISQRALGAQYGIHQAQVSRVIARRTFAA